MYKVARVYDPPVHVRHVERPVLGYGERVDREIWWLPMTTLTCWFCGTQVKVGETVGLSRVDGDSCNGYEPVHEGCAIVNETTY